MGVAQAVGERAVEGGARDYARMERALAWLAEHYAEQPSLAEAARATGLAPHHFQRTFRRWVGLTPKQLVGYLTLERAKAALAASASVLEAAYAAGLSGPGRLHDLFVQLEALTPGEYRRAGAGLRIAYGYHPSPFGECLLLATERGLCALGFTCGDRRRTLAGLAAGWPGARLEEDAAATAGLAERVFGGGDGPALRVLVRASAFQVRVWEALLRIPPGALVSYRGLAERIGAPRAVRAVAAATARNPVAWVIPCHRVIRANGLLAGYRWGLGRKLAMLSREALSSGSRCPDGAASGTPRTAPR